RLQDENRLKAEGYRLKETESQTKDHRETELLSGDQIEQGGKTTTNHELQTTSCNTQDDNLECYLMMNPEEIREVEDIAGFTRINRLPSRSTPFTTTEGARLAEGESSISAAIGGEKDVDEASFKEDINENNVEENISTLEQNIARLTHQIEEAKQKYKEKSSVYFRFWNNIAIKLEQSRDSWNKVSELIAQGKQEKVFLWKKSAEESEAAAEKLKRTFQFYTSDQNEAAKQLEEEAWKDYYLSDAFTWLLKSEEALDFFQNFTDVANCGVAPVVEASSSSCTLNFCMPSIDSLSPVRITPTGLLEASSGSLSRGLPTTGIPCTLSALASLERSPLEKVVLIKGGEIDLWKNLAEQYQVAADFKKQAAEVSIEEKKDKRDSYSLAGDYMCLIANRKLKAFEARKSGKETLATEYENIVGILQKALDYLKQSHVAYSAGKHREGSGWYNAGKSLQPQADYLLKSCEEEDAGKTILAVCYREAAATSEMAANRTKTAAELDTMGQNYEDQVKKEEELRALRNYEEDYNTSCSHMKYFKKYEEGIGWRDVAHSLQDKADYQAKACEAKEVGKLILAACYQEAILISQHSADQHELSAKINTILREGERLSWKYAGTALRCQAEYQAKAYEVEEIGKLLLAADYRELAAIAKRAAELYELSVKAYIEENKKRENIVWTYENESEWHSWLSAGRNLRSKMRNKEKAMKAQEAGKTILAAGYREAVVIAEHAADCFKKAAVAKAIGKKNENIGWFRVGEVLELQREYYIKLIEAQESKKENVASIYREAIGVLKKTADYYQQAACAFALGKEAEGSSWLNVGVFLQSRTKEQMEIAEKKESEKNKIKKSDNKEITLETIQVNECFPPEPLIKRQRIDNPAKSKALFIYCEKWLVETNPSIGREPILSDYMIDILKRGVDYELIKIFEEYWNHVVKAHEVGDDPLALGWIQVVEDIQQTIEDSIKTPKLSGSENHKLLNAWNTTIQAGKKLAEYRGKYIQEEKLSQIPEILSVQKKILEKLQLVAEYHRKSAEACALKNEQEYNCFKSAAWSMTENIQQLGNVIKVFKKLTDIVTERQPEVSNCYRKTLDQYKESAEYHCRTAQAIANGNISDYDFLKKAGNSAEYSAKGLEEACVAVEQAIKAKEVNQEELAASWFEVAHKYEESAEYHSQSVKAIVSGNSSDYKRLKDAGDASRSSAYELEKVAEAKEKQLK
ncbi:MAG TPA: hypothetical protein VJK54_05865, partial [Chthoniobacterales bacterium]|nr:hypothetical protein [Chthoniobacterales bacterium]